MNLWLIARKYPKQNPQFSINLFVNPQFYNNKWSICPSQKRWEEAHDEDEVLSVDEDYETEDPTRRAGREEDEVEREAFGWVFSARFL